MGLCLVLCSGFRVGIGVLVSVREGVGVAAWVCVGFLIWIEVGFWYVGRRTATNHDAE